MSAVEVDSFAEAPLTKTFSRRRSSADRALSPSAIPDLAVLPKPYAADKVRVGQLVSPTSMHNPSGLTDRDYDDVGHRWYKDVVLMDSNTGLFKESLGGVMYTSKPEEGTEVGTIEAREMRVRLLKNNDRALEKMLQEKETKEWVLEQAKKGDVGFVTAVREVTNASYRHASLVDRGAGNWEVVREIKTGDASLVKRRDSGLDVETGSKNDVVGVVVREVLVEGDNVMLGEELGTEFWQ